LHFVNLFLLSLAAYSGVLPVLDDLVDVPGNELPHLNETSCRDLVNTDEEPWHLDAVKLGQKLVSRGVIHWLLSLFDDTCRQVIHDVLLVLHITLTLSNLTVLSLGESKTVFSGLTLCCHRVDNFLLLLLHLELYLNLLLL